jgi:RND family efflux transporter MFP subunit
MLLGKGAPAETSSALRTVTLESVGSLSGNGSSVSVVGTVRSVSEADVLAQSGGTVRRVHTSLGARVPAGFIIAELENASERAVVLQAQGAYEAALAARSITLLQAGNTEDSLEEAELSVRNTYRSAYTTADNTLETYVDPLMEGSDRVGGLDLDDREDRQVIWQMMREWRMSLDEVSSQNAEALIVRAENNTRQIAGFLTELSRKVNDSNSGATATQRANISTARTTIDTLLANLSREREALRAAETAAQVAGRQTTTSSTQTASADASVKQALGSLRLAQASLEKTIVRAPIAGTVNFLPIRVGDYVTSFTHVATVANNGSLEIVTYVSEADRELISAGEEVTVEETYEGVITSIAPALDPTTKRIEVRIAVNGDAELVNGQSVRIGFQNLAPASEEEIAGPVLLPLAAVKLRTDDRVVFTVNEENRLVAVPVEIGEVRGDRIEVLSSLPLEVRIVADARGLADGQQVNVAD